MNQEDYLEILRAMQELPFNLGRKALVAMLQGDSSHSTVARNRLDRERCFGRLSGYDQQEIHAELSRLKRHGLITKTRPKGTFYRVLQITERGIQELKEPTLQDDEVRFRSAAITEQDRALWEQFDFFLARYNDGQKKAITSRAPRMLCVAGAGTGKTTVLTKRIEFLVRFRSVPRDRILAITFTRKAREEMMRRLQGSVQVETFNSFGERLLRTHGTKLYGKSVRLLQYRDKMRLLHHALAKLGMDMANCLQLYFTDRQRREHGNDKLSRLFLHDIYSILEYYSNNDSPLEDFSSHSVEAKMVHTICRSIRQEMREVGLRTYADQLRDCLRLLRKHPELIPQYDHVLVDEYQDVNAIQIKLLDILRAKNLFAVGDPRQAIFGWRGSRVQFILDFEKRHDDAQVVVLKRNYRSGKRIVELANMSIARLQLPDLVHHEGEGETKLHSFRAAEDEREFLAEKILSAEHRREEIFVLARTNRQLRQLSEVFTARGIEHVTRSDEQKLATATEGQVTLSTVHAIKGLEADCVFVAHCDSRSYPCIASDHPVLEMVKREQMDREEEELRLLYVALSRARKELHVSYSGKQSRFLTPSMKKHLGHSYDRSLAKDYKGQGPNGDLFQRLREWRTQIARRSGVPPYMIFSDKTLLELAEKRPSGLAELHGVHGVGPAKAQKYGDELLALLR